MLSRGTVAGVAAALAVAAGAGGLVGRETADTSGAVRAELSRPLGRKRTLAVEADRDVLVPGEREFVEWTPLAPVPSPPRAWLVVRDDGTLPCDGKIMVEAYPATRYATRLSHGMCLRAPVPSKVVYR